MYDEFSQHITNDSDTLFLHREREPTAHAVPLTGDYHSLLALVG